MSNVSKNILEDIETILDNIHMKLISFQSLYSTNCSYEDKKEISNVLNLVNKTQNIYLWSHRNGSFPNTNHSTKYTDIMAKWSALIDDLFWSLFGSELIFETTEENRIRIIYLKLNEINMNLTMYTPTFC